MTDMRVTQRYRGKLQPTEAFNIRGSNTDPLKPGLPQEPGFLFGSCESDRCSFGCARAQAPAGPVCMCAATFCRRSRHAAVPARSLAAVACGHSREGIASLAQWIRAPVYEAGGRRFDSFTRRQFSFLSRWTSGEVLGPSSRRGGFDSRTGYQTKACRRALASTGANRPQRLGGVGTRHRQPLSASTVCGASGKRICFGSRGLQVRVLLHGPGSHVAIAQMEERRSVEPEVAGSGPAGGAK